MISNRLAQYLLVVVFLLASTACGNVLADTSSPSSTATSPSVLPTATFPSVTPKPSPVPTITLSPPGVWIAPELPLEFKEKIHIPSSIRPSSSPELAAVAIEIGAEAPIAYWIYALVAPFPTILDDVSGDTIRQAWAGQPSIIFSEQPLLLSEETLKIFIAWWGEPAPEAVKVLADNDLLDYAWQNRPALALVPFDALEPRWKVLTVDGTSPLHTDFVPDTYALSVPISLGGNTDALGLGSLAELGFPITNRDPEKLTTVIMSGVTALVRATAWTMEFKGVLYPAEEIGDLLRSADITHVSNEVPFDPTCPRANPNQAELVFCTPVEYIQLLEAVGTDVVELTGDHFIDRGAEATIYTLQMYKDRNLPYYGGGANLEEGLRPVLFDHNGNKIAFVGCNAKGGGYATASEDYPGAAACGIDKLQLEITQLVTDGYQVIATFQHQERYSYIVNSQDRLDYIALADAGAVIVQGSQAHQPQNFEFYKQAFLHFGLGNLFFDQLLIQDVGGERVADKAFIDRHVFYNGRYLSTELLTIQFVDFAKPRWMTQDERVAFLQRLFQASGWW